MSQEQPSRRTLVAGLAAGSVAVPLIAACGSAGTTAPSGAARTPAAGSTHGASKGKGGGTVLGPTSEIPLEGGKVFGSEQVVVTQPTQGDFKAFSAICTHQGCLVSTVSADVIHCPCHGSQFSAKDGSVVVGPASAPLAAKKIAVKGGEIRLI